MIAALQQELMDLSYLKEFWGVLDNWAGFIVTAFRKNSTTVVRPLRRSGGMRKKTQSRRTCSTRGRGRRPTHYCWRRGSSSWTS